MATPYYILKGDRLERVYAADMTMANPAADDFAAIGAYPKGPSAMPDIPTDGRRLVRTGYTLNNGQWIEAWEVTNGPVLSESEQESIEARNALKGADVSDGLGSLTFDQKDALILSTIKAVKGLI